MGNLRAVVTIAAIAFTAACGDDGGATIDAPKIIDAAPDAPPDAYVPDAPNYDFSCLNNQQAAAAANVMLSGTVTEISLNLAANPPIASNPASGVVLEACKANCTGLDSLDTTAATGATGAFTTASLATGGQPLDGYLKATKGPNWDTYVYPAAPLVTSQAMVPVLMLTDQVGDNLSAVVTHTAGRGVVAVFVTDCAGTPIGGATVTVTRGSTTFPGTQAAGSFSPMGEGAFITFDIPPDTNTTVTTVNATYMGMTLRAHDVKVFANSLTATQVKPGF